MHWRRYRRLKTRFRAKYGHEVTMKTKKIAAGEFKARCLAIMDEVQAKRETIIITKRGKPIAN